MTCLLGAPESGKSEVIRLLAGVNKSNFSGNCLVSQNNMLQGDVLPGNKIGVCL